MGLSIYPVILLIVIFWYVIVPLTGGFFNRYKWKKFRSRFNEIRLSQLLNYSQYTQMNEKKGLFRFTGNIESITDGHTLWIRGDDLTMPVSIEKTICYLLPKHEGEGLPEAPEQIRWNQTSTLTEGTKVFIGGELKIKNNRLNFVSSKEHPLMIIFYNCPDDKLAFEVVRASRTRNEYWNSFTPASLVIGALILVYIAASFLNRPAFRLTVITAFASIFVPALSVFPPGFIFTVFYRRLTLLARRLRVTRDLALFNLLPKEITSPQKTAIRGTIRAYFIEAFAWILLLLGIIINIVFIFLILIFFEVINF
ncbi:MAG: hypothetical protein FWD28_09335 [Treponema sp.]|nr:hypothetical protein [Treponema sp.]